jgi:hypothetical protein
MPMVAVGVTTLCRRGWCAGNPAADDAQRTGEQAHAETVGRLVLGGEAFGDEFGARAHGDHAGVVGLEHGLGQGGRPHFFADLDHVALARCGSSSRRSRQKARCARPPAQATASSACSATSA